MGAALHVSSPSFYLIDSLCICFLQRGLNGRCGQYCPFQSGIYSKADLII